ncbi:hypothetical protein os1_23290 [Comamonadaceae bacterium OS-1]|nr:hypothetical protein os1_23290 [Comamonadaceae bacterium OS-1]
MVDAVPLPSSCIPALVDALRNDPFYAAITADFAHDAAQRHATLARYLAYAQDEAARSGRCVLAPDATQGAALWLLPGTAAQQAADSAAKAHFLATALGPQGLENYHRIVGFMGPRAEALVDASDWYLSILGIAPAAQNTGLGARLLRATLAEADAAGVGSYIETFEPRNIRFYARLGYATLGVFAEPVTGCDYTLMRRPAA